jgi:CDP-diacylglycerol--glycerol-3-phosphate 3-phosphatidyltransferase
MIDKRWRSTVEAALRPVGRGLHRIGVTPDALTVIGLLFSVFTMWAAATGRFGWAVLGLILTGLPDILDGSVARNSGAAGPRGSFFDSVADRVSDFLILGGIAWYLADGAHPRQAVLALAVAGVSMLISYERAKAESLGLNAKGGLLERAERLILLGIGFVFDIIVPVMWLMLVLGLITVVYRFVKVWKQAGKPTGVIARQPLRVNRTRRVSTNPDAQPPTRRIADWWESRRPGPSRRERTRPSRARTRRSRP